MEQQRIFVGRKPELEQFKALLADPRGQAVVVVGQAGMGKTWLLDRMMLLAQDHRDFKCGCVRYEVTPTDSVDMTMSLMMDNAFEAAQTQEGSFDKTDRRRAQWTALLKAMVPTGRNLAWLIQSLRRDPQRHTRDQFLERLRLISKCMPENGRALFVIDPEKKMADGSADSWRLVVRELPEKVMFVFAQRPEDALVTNNAFMALDNVARIPQERLGVLAPEDVDDLVRLRTDDVRQPGNVLRQSVERYQGHPYAIQAALDIAKKTGTTEGLPPDPTDERIAETQWEQVCRTGDDAIRLFETYAILEVGVPDEVVQRVGGINATIRKHLHSDTYLRGLLREGGQGRRLYHAILADHIRSQIGEAEAKAYHARAVGVYRAQLKHAKEQQTKPDALAATHLPEHVLVSGGEEAFVEAFVNECTRPLLSLGLFDAATSLSGRALEAVGEDSHEKATLLGNLGLVYRIRGDLDEAEAMHRKALEIHKELGWLEGMANQYGSLGLIYCTGGDLDKAQEMHRKALEIYEKLGHREAMAIQYGNLGSVYRIRGDLEKAEEMHRMALEIAEQAGRIEAMANQYGNLGLIYQDRGDLGEAEAMLGKALEIYEQLGHLESMAGAYGNLGLIYSARGDLDQAEAMHRKALEINEELGLCGGVAAQYGNLGNIHFSGGDLDKAEEMYRKSLEINEQFGLREGMANQYGNLGSVFEQRGDRKQARALWEKSLALFQKIGMPQKVEKTQGWIDALEDQP